MHNEDYIASGVLELYAAGGLSLAEREEVERRAAASPEIRKALDEACMAMEEYAVLHAVQPRPELKNRILDQINASIPTHTSEPDTAHNNVTQLLYEEDKAASPYRWMFAASIVLFLLSGWMSFHFYTKWQQAEQKLATVTADQELLAQNFKNTSFQLQQQEQKLAILQDPAFKPVKLKGVEAHPDASLQVYWNPQQQQVYVNVVKLPAPPAGKQYQLWALKDGQPIDAGMIEISGNKGTMQQMKNIGAAQAFAVTLEPVGGSKVPTLEQLTVIGNVES
ncbi:anti-sigma factor [Pontibacter fetidus]|uniref:Regulator of SigK n=1 Tax=Pontibacter fetidus TaxID=2700082 RepID=A0A6B2GZU2_9BACT|nr:anti-sigma factor [Pontibacter fetidus]NDK55563.1 anti-sigma factor [Pontibacter fetidus]